MKNSYLIIYVLALALWPITLQAEEVEVNLDVLEGYTPPPMFGAPPSTPVEVKPILTKPAPPRRDRSIEVLKPSSAYKNPAPASLETIVETTNAADIPLPGHKPHFTRKAPRRNTQIDITEKPKSLKAQKPHPAFSTPDPEVEDPRSNIISLGFLPGIEALTEQIKPSLIKKIHRTLNENPAISRIEVHAYASSNIDEQSSARRLSLARALDIRDFLIANNIDPKSIDVRAFGSNTDTVPLDRVDILFIEIPK